jgi:hypothetical protein
VLVHDLGIASLSLSLGSPLDSAFLFSPIGGFKVIVGIKIKLLGNL